MFASRFFFPFSFFGQKAKTKKAKIEQKDTKENEKKYSWSLEAWALVSAFALFHFCFAFE